MRGQFQSNFNGDGISDVLYVTGAKWFVSHSRTSTWKQINTSSASPDQLLVGDFDGNGKADIFRADGADW